MKMKILYSIALIFISISVFAQRQRCLDDERPKPEQVSKSVKPGTKKIRFPKGYQDSIIYYSNEINYNYFDRERTRSFFLQDFIKHNNDCEYLDSIIKVFCDSMKIYTKNDTYYLQKREEFLTPYQTKKCFISFRATEKRKAKRNQKLIKRNVPECLPQLEEENKNCVEEWTKYRDQLCLNSCDSCNIIEKYCQRVGKSFNKEKCKCYIPSVPKRTAYDNIEQIANENSPPCQNITLEVRATNQGRDLWVALYYDNPNTNDTCIGGGELTKTGYARGKYDIPVELKNYLNDFFKNMKSMFERQGWPDNSARVNIVGMADGYEIDSYIKYEGYKNIVGIPDIIDMKKRDYLIVDSYKKVDDCGHKGKNDFTFNSKNNNQNKIRDNIQLAYLRAYPIRHILEQNLPDLKNFGTYTIATPEKNETGEFRRVEVYLLIRGASLETNGFEQIHNVWLNRMKTCAEE